MRQVFDIPDRGDIIVISIPAGSPARTGRMPARRAAIVVLSPQAYNGRAGLAVCCPIAARASGYPFEVSVPLGLPVSGVVLADQAISLDWRALRAEKAAALPAASVDEVLAKLRAVLS
jgi:mRNA interferase MazF